MRFERRYTQAGESPFAGMAFRAADSEIRNPDGKAVFQQAAIEVPAHWSQVATDVLAQKYFRRAGVPTQTVAVREDGVPEWLQRNKTASEETPTGSETDSRQVFRRLAGCWTYWGWKGG